MVGYPYKEIEAKWQSYWYTNKTFRVPDKIDQSRPKFYALDMFPYPSGDGLHVGHPEGYTASDIVARYKRMRGFNVLHPIGWDAFGLPTEQFALRTGAHPKITTEKNINRFRKQLKSLGFSYDWDREINTTDPSYYKWTQWIFKKLFERGLAYQEEMPVWWCEELGTTLANEEVIDGKSEVGNFPCTRRPLRQWVLKITEYADKLLDGLGKLDWPESTKEMQRNWIGRSEGAQIDFNIEESSETIRVFTTRPDTLFGATYIVIAPEHPIVSSLTQDTKHKQIQKYCIQATRKSELERSDLQKSKTGIFTGSYAINPVNKKRIPIWIADYVLGNYGTGAIMAVPGEDQRDWEFAKAHGLPIIRTVAPPENFEGEAYTGQGPSINSDFLNGLSTEEAKKRIAIWIKEKNVGGPIVNYKLRNWLFSRQRYWGEPFPIVFVDGSPFAVPDEELPVELPEIKEFKPSGTPEGPLVAAENWLNTVEQKTGKDARRETNTMPQWAGSCWYYLRYLDPKNRAEIVAADKESYWMPVDLYVGGQEHAVLHLLYARFWHKVLNDAGIVSTPEPFAKLVHQGMILGELEHTKYVDEAGIAVSAEKVRDQHDTRSGKKLESVSVSGQEIIKKDDYFVLADNPNIKVHSKAHKMSKSRGNVVNPDKIIESYGADAFRLYEMFMGPLEQVKPWNTSGVEGTKRFLNRAWRLIVDDKKSGIKPNIKDQEPSIDQLQVLHETIRVVTEDIESMRFNTAIAVLMEFVNAANKWATLPHSVAKSFALILAPLAPHIAEELWARLGNKESLAYETWPQANPAYLKKESLEIPVQVNGKIRGRITIPFDTQEDKVIALAREDENVSRHLMDKDVKRAIYIQKRIVNFVVGTK